MTKLYEQDYFAWTQDQADALRRRSVNELDWDNLLEEVEGLGRQERNELRSHLIILMVHLLNWRLQPERRGRSWALAIAEQRREAENVLAENPSLKPGVENLLDNAYRVARIRAARQTRLSTKVFPVESPFSWHGVLHDPEITES